MRARGIIAVRPLVGMWISFALTAAATLALGASGCGASSSSTSGGTPDPEPEVHGVDLLLVVDNSISMADKQALLAPSIARLLGDLTNPPCFDAAGARAANQPARGVDACPSGSSRRMEPVTSLHLGVISSSLGALGAEQCDGVEGAQGKNDRAHLLSRGPTTETAFPGDEETVVPTYQDAGYLAWDPDASMSPPGESDFDTLVQRATDMVVGVGEVGCGYEMPLEAATRFLADPAPYDHLETSNGIATPVGVDETLLAQRAAFLRPDSLVAVVLLSDENDCSIDVTKQPAVLLGGSTSMFRARSECATDPNDACCTSCGLEAPAGCPVDAACETDPMIPIEENPVNLRCFDQKRRFGFDFTYPTERYVHAFTDATIDPSSATFEAPAMGGVANPLFADGERLPKHVLFTSIVGVPWQDLATDPSNASSPLKSTSQMEADGTWTHLLGASGGAPTDPFMIESASPRSGTSPFTGESVTVGNSINSGDRSIPNADDLEYVCTFGLETPIESGECGDPEGNPICDGETQIAAKAYPGTRQLALVRALGDRGIAASICSPGATATSVDGPPPVAQAATAYLASMQQLELTIANELTPSSE